MLQSRVRQGWQATFIDVRLFNFSKKISAKVSFDFATASQAPLRLYSQIERLPPCLCWMGPISVRISYFLDRQAIHSPVMLRECHMNYPKYLSELGHLILN